MAFDEEIRMPRAIPAGLTSGPDSFGSDVLDAALGAMVKGNALTTTCFALFAPSGSGKSATAADLVRRVKASLPWLAGISAPWLTAAWIAQYAVGNVHDEITGEPVNRVLAACRLLAIDGLGEEDERGRSRVVNVTKDRLDAGRPMIITSRLRLDGPGSLAALYPHIRHALKARFVYVSV